MKKKGFTLTEMIAVIVIIGLIILVAIPVSQNLMANNKTDKYKLYVETVEKAIYTYVDMTNISGDNNITLDTLINEGYLQGFEENGVTVDTSTTISINVTNRRVTFSGTELKLNFTKRGDPEENTCCTKKSCTSC